MLRGVIVPFQTFILSVFARSLRSNFYELHFRALNVVCVSQKIDFVFLIGWFAGLKVDLRTFSSPVGEIVRNKCSLLFRIFFEEWHPYGRMPWHKPRVPTSGFRAKS